MGVDKARLGIEGRPLALRAATEVARVCRLVALVGDPKKYRDLGLRVVPDEFPGAGPLAGIEAALCASPAPWNLIVACDMPALNPSIFEELFEAAVQEENADGALPQYSDGRVEPLCAVYHKRCHAVIRAALEAGVRKVTDSLRPLAIRYLQVASEAPFANLNTPEELRKYLHG
jgi:molybdopterin-guanine dinucleotide biosynthesis protein A